MTHDISPTNPPEGYIHDFVSGIPVRATPEEVEATQPFARALVNDYGYPRENITTRPQFRVKSSPSDTTKSYPVDIAVFDTKSKLPNDVRIIVEAKKRDRNDGEDQLKDYMRLSSAQLGVWTNGQERTFWEKYVTNDGVEFRQLPNIPRFGESIGSIGKYTKSDLVVPRDLKAVFRSMRNHLSANVVGTSRDEVLAIQLINLVFCKIYDERFTADAGLLEFRAAADESSEMIHERIAKLFARVKAKYNEVFDSDDKLTLDPASLRFAVGELQAFSLLGSPRDAVGEAFETFIGATLKGSQGQFFTPRNVVSAMVEYLNPSRDELVIDPACGAAGFLVETLRHKWAEVEAQGEKLGWSEAATAEEKQSVAIKTLYGIEKDELLSKVAKAYMAIMGDGKGSIFSTDSLERPFAWPPTVQSHVTLGKFDVVLANPPFGKDIRVTGAEKLSQYSLAYTWKKNKDGTFTRGSKLKDKQNPQTLFIERCLQLLKPGGRLGIVLPESFFHAPSNRHVIQLLREHNILGAIDLPHNTFRPFNNAKCIAIFIQKDRPQQSTMIMGAAEQMGHDHIGRTMYRWDPSTGTHTDEVWDDVEEVTFELREKERLKYTFEVSAERVLERGIIIPRYYWPERDIAASIEADPTVEATTVQELIDKGWLEVRAGHGSPEAKYKGLGTFPYIRVKDIINWEIYKDPTARIPGDIFDALVGSHPLEVRDIVMVARGSYRIGDCAMVGPSDVDVALTREILIFRVLDERLDAFYLLYLLSLDEVRRQIENRVFVDTTLPTLGDRWKELDLPFSRDLEERRKISNRVSTALMQRWASLSDIESIRASIGASAPPEVAALDNLLQNDA
ncbi:N-6 DNA methylase [Curtobacterium sp. NPDC086286]|uniref:N-6 DNA methylase n=1 Tax=Curtobacterium sp. NPDC086286 TaxID=3363964 RepID=UPI00380EC8FC